MNDYIIYYKTKNTQTDTIITLEDNCPTSDFLEEIILEELREQLGDCKIEIIEIQPLVDYSIDVENIE